MNIKVFKSEIKQATDEELQEVRKLLHLELQKREAKAKVCKPVERKPKTKSDYSYSKLAAFLMNKK